MNYGLLFICMTGFAFGDPTQIRKHEGESVILHVNKTEHRFKDYLWTFGPHTPLIAITMVANGEVIRINGTRFGNRLNTHVETGSITISNLTTNDTGIFLAQFFTESGTLTQMFNLTISDNLVFPRDVLEGNNVTLEATNENVERNDTVSWTLSEDCRSKRIAQWKNFTIFINEGFEDVLQMDQHNGSLTLIKVTKNNAGIYCVRVLPGTDPHPRTLRKYRVTVYEHVSKPHITTAQTNISTPPVDDGSCYINCSVKNTPNVTLTWYKEEEKINQTNNPDIAVDLILPLDIQNHNKYTYSCVAANPVSNESVNISSTRWCPHHGKNTGPGINYYYIIIVPVVVGLIAVWYKRRRIQRNNEGQADCCGLGNLNMSSQNVPESEENNETDEQHPLTSGSQTPNQSQSLSA